MTDFVSAFAPLAADASGRRETYIGAHGTGDLLSAFLEQHQEGDTRTSMTPAEDVQMSDEPTVDQSFAARFPTPPAAVVEVAPTLAPVDPPVSARRSARASVTLRGTKAAASSKPPLATTTAIRQAKLAEWKNNTTATAGSSTKSANENRFATTAAAPLATTAALSAKRKSVGLTPSTSATNLRQTQTGAGVPVKKARVSSVGLISSRGIKIDAPPASSMAPSAQPSPRKQWDGKRKSMALATASDLPTVSELSPNHPTAAHLAKTNRLTEEKSQWQASAQWRMLLLRVQKAELTAVKAQLEQAESSHASVLRDLAVAESNLTSAVDREQSLQTRLAASTNSESMLRLAAEELGSKVDDLRAQMAQQTREYESEVAQLKGELQANQRTATEAEQASARQVREMSTTISSLTSSESALRDQLSTTLRELANVNAQRYADEQARKKLHATIQDLKGSIRVFCRIRPAGVTAMRDTNSHADQPVFTRTLATTDYGSGGNGGGGALSNFTENLVVQAPAGWKTNLDGSASKASTMTFNVDKVFDQSSSQADLFRELEELIVSAMDASVNTSVFAYGATGSGKTHTMMNVDAETPDQVGMIPRAIDRMFAYAAKAAGTAATDADDQQKQDRAWTFTFKAALLEIHNEELKDLMSEHAKSGNAPLPSPSVASTRDSKSSELKIAHDKSGRVVVHGLETFPVHTAADVHTLLASGTKHRSVSATACNSRSSRSHTIFQLWIDGACASTGEKIASMVNLIDLAGSERLDASKAGGDAALLRETQSINSSLSALVTCMSSIASKAAHIPYRSSTLTHLLQHALGKNEMALARTLFFVNISPEACNYAETLCTMRFAEKLKSVEMNTTAATTTDAANKRPKRK